MSVFVPAYWPFFKTAERRTFDYTSSDLKDAPFSSIFSYNASNDSMTYDDFDANGVWTDTWLYQYRKGFGVAEWRDDYPQSGWLATAFGPTKRVVFSTPIGWGEFQDIGGAAYLNRPILDPFLSAPPQFGSCMQCVKFENVLPTFGTRMGRMFSDVLVFSYLQLWGTRCTGARYWMAKGVGPVALQWLGVAPDQVQLLAQGDPSKINLITSNRFDAHVTIVNGLSS